MTSSPAAYTLPNKKDTMQSFINIMRNKGYTEGASGRFFNPDAARYDSGVTVELRDESAVMFSGKLTKKFLNTPTDLLAFRECV